MFLKLLVVVALCSSMVTSKNVYRRSAPPKTSEPPTVVGELRREEKHAGDHPVKMLVASEAEHLAEVETKVETIKEAAAKVKSAQSKRHVDAQDDKVACCG